MSVASPGFLHPCCLNCFGRTPRFDHYDYDDEDTYDDDDDDDDDDEVEDDAYDWVPASLLPQLLWQDTQVHTSKKLESLESGRRNFFMFSDEDNLTKKTHKTISFTSISHI